MQGQPEVYCVHEPHFQHDFTNSGVTVHAEITKKSPKTTSCTIEIGVITGMAATRWNLPVALSCPPQYHRRHSQCRKVLVNKPVCCRQYHRKKKNKHIHKQGQWLYLQVEPFFTARWHTLLAQLSSPAQVQNTSNPKQGTTAVWGEQTMSAGEKNCLQSTSLYKLGLCPRFCTQKQENIIVLDSENTSLQ